MAPKLERPHWDQPDDPIIPYRLSDHDLLTRLQSDMAFYGKLVGVAVSLSGLAVALIVAFGSHIL